ncbi:MAG: hypothetical protein HZA90_01960 [Verrucomicrobia bacterium]|nr:hypothetical protein [Verrucomicrobiota bacterium]
MDAGWDDWRAIVAGDRQQDLGELSIPKTTDYEIAGLPNLIRPNALFVDLWKLQTPYVHPCVTRLDVNGKPMKTPTDDSPQDDLEKGYWVGSSAYESSELDKISNDSTAFVTIGYFDGLPETPGLRESDDPSKVEIDDSRNSGQRTIRWARWFPFDPANSRYPTPCDPPHSPTIDVDGYLLGSVSGDADHDTICDEYEEYLANKYAPIYVHQYHENFWPTDPRTVLRSKVYCASVSYNAWWEACGLEANYEACEGWPSNYWSDRTWVYEGETGFTFDVWEESHEMHDLLCDFGAVTAEMSCGRTPDLYHFHHTYMTRDGNLNITYWRYYDFNDVHFDPANNYDHEGDWENIRVILKPFWSSHLSWDHGVESARVQMARHGDEYKDLVQPMWRGTHPIVLVEEGTHAAYASKGDWEGTPCSLDPSGAPACYLDSCKGYDGGSFPPYGECFDGDGDPLTVWESWTEGKIWSGFRYETEAECDGDGGSISSVEGHLKNLGSRLHPLNDMYYELRYSGRWGRSSGSPTGPVYGRCGKGGSQPGVYQNQDECFMNEERRVIDNPWCHEVNENRLPRE